MEKNKNGTSASVVAKAGIWYTVCNFLFRGMAFITTPVFTRLLTKSELGDFSNFASWVSILTVVTAFDLQTSIIRSKLEHEDDIDSYIWSILSFTSIATLVLYAVVLIFPAFFQGLFQTDMRYIHIMFAYLLFSPAYQMLITKHRAFYKYKMFVALTGVTIVSATGLSLILVLLMEDKLAGRIIGNYLPYILIGVVIYIYLVARGRKIKVKYWKYACVICLPLVPHVLSLYLLSSSDKIIITKLSGGEYTAIYSIAYTCYHIFTILFDSMNKAWAPWLLESLHHKKYNEIKRVSKAYIGIFIILTFALLIIVPELILILGGKQYQGAIYCLPPLITSCVFQFIYTMYVNIEFYEKKTIGVAFATMAATAVNIILNFAMIPMSPENGHIIASYTTLAGYILLFVLHYILVKRLNMHRIYDTKFVIVVLMASLLISFGMNYLYATYIPRYIIFSLYFATIMVAAYKKRNVIMKFCESMKLFL